MAARDRQTRQQSKLLRIMAGNSTLDHVTITRFRVRHEQALAGLPVASLKLCAAAGLVRLGLIAPGWHKIAANAAAAAANRTHAHLEGQVAQLLQQAAAVDQAEDRKHGAARGDELPSDGQHQRSRQPLCPRRASRLRLLSIANVPAILEAPELLLTPGPPWPPRQARKDGKPSESKSDTLRARCGPGWTALRARPTTPSAAGPSNRSSGRSRPSSAPNPLAAGS
jgi:hypothetical protein